jgi:hypothetical protein
MKGSRWLHGRRRPQGDKGCPRGSLGGTAGGHGGQWEVAGAAGSCGKPREAAVGEVGLGEPQEAMGGGRGQKGNFELSYLPIHSILFPLL